MAISEIEKLERRYQENPQGLTFAPLAEAYRKSGDPEKALARLAPGLELHPDYIPASIVQGRCYLDMRNDPAAEASFAHVLTLDPENVIALKALADITERGTRFEDSERWLVQLLSVDRSNEDAEEQLARVRANREQQVAAGAAAAASSPDASVDSVAVEVVEGLESTPAEGADFSAPHDALPPLSTVERETEDAVQSGPGYPVDALETTALADATEPPGESEVATGFVGSSHDEVNGGSPAEPASVLDDPTLGVTQLGGGEEIVLNPGENSEYQLPSASEQFSGSPAISEKAVSEYQLPSASEELGGAAALDPSGGSVASEYQLPSASDDLTVPSLSGSSASEYQLPDASSDIAKLVAASNEEGNEFQTPDPSAALLISHSTPVEPPRAAPPVTEPVAAPPAAEDEAPEPAGAWTTWSDAALDAGALPFAADDEVTPAEQLTAAAALLPEPVIDQVETVETVETVNREAEVVEVVDIAEVVDIVEVVEPDAAAEPELVVTESMAELFVTQGHPADALRIYRELLLRRAGDERLLLRVAELETLAAASDAPLPRYAASHSGGTSVRELMRSVLTSRPNGLPEAAAAEAPGGDTPGTPTRPAPDHLTLSAIFGDDSAPLPPVMRPPPAGGPADKGVSFDEFYGSPTRTVAQRERTTRVSHGEDDLDQFHDWLQNLKR